MPESKDVLAQFLDLPAERREEMAARLFALQPRDGAERSPAAFPSVVRTPEVCGGSPRLIRTRIPVWLLQHLRRSGFSEATILESYPTLTDGDLVQAWGYVAAHQAEIDEEIAENERY